MRDLLSWNLPLGRWAGVQIRLHVFFLLFVLVTLHASVAGHDARQDFFWEAVSGLTILLASVLLHEIAHCVVARRVGGTADQILIWPLGGLAHVSVPHEPYPELETAVAGPLANLLVCLATLPLLAWSGLTLLDGLHLMDPLRPPAAPKQFTWQVAVGWVFWINWTLFLVNLLPAFPLDGSRILRALLWPRLSFQDSVVVVSRVALVTALVLWVAAALLHSSYPFAVLPLALLGIILFFCAKQEADRAYDHTADDGLFGYDFSQGYTSLERAQAPPRKRAPGLWRRWVEKRRLERQRRQQQIEADEERRVDEVLCRLHEAGMQGLSSDDRALLDRVSARYRNRERR